MTEPRLSLTQPSRRDFLRMVGAGAALAATGGLAACGSSDEDQGAASANVMFTSWSLQETGTSEVIENLIANYEQQTEATIETNAYPYDEYQNQLLLQIRGGNIPGAAVHAAFDWTPAFARAGDLTDLGQVAEEAGYTEVALQSGKFEGTQYGLPWTTASIGMVANSELLEKAGVSEMPKTVEELEASLEALKGVGNGVIPYAAMTAPDQLKDIIPWIWTFGGDVISDGEVALGDEGSVRAVEWYKSLLDRGYITKGMNRFDARALFAQGKIGMYEDAIIARSFAAERSSDPNFADQVVPVPRPVTDGTGDPQALLWGHVIVVPDGEGSEAATDFVRWITSDMDATLKYFEETELPPTTEKAINSETVQSNEYVAKWTEQITDFAQVNPFTTYSAGSRMEQILGEQVEAALLGRKSAQAAMDTAREEIKGLIK